MKTWFLAGFLAVTAVSSAFAGSTFATVASASGCSSLPCDESTTSLGQFIIKINPAFQAAFVGTPGYDPTSGLLTSPLLFDSNTVIGLSTSYIDGLRPGTLPVGTTGQVSGVNVTAVTENAGNAPTALPSQFPTGNDAISTAILNVQLTGGGGVSVTMGASYPGQGLMSGTPNLGEVEASGCSNNTPAGCNDFPAQSFFDVFADVSIPGLGTFSNTAPLVVSSELPAPGSLPPHVVYVHGTSSTVGIFADTNEGPFTQGEQLGTFMLTGHGVSYTNSATDEAAFGTALEQDIAADAYNPTTNPNGFTPEETQFLDSTIAATDGPEPSTVLLLFSGAAGLLGWRRLRRSN